MCYSGLIYKTCLTQQHLNSLNAFIAEGVVWRYKFPKYFTPDFLIDNQCQSGTKIAVVQILPVLDTAPKIVYYDNCALALMAACKRQVIGVPKPSQHTLNRIKAYMNEVILPELSIILQDFHYSYEVWYNHLTYNQQLEIDAVDELSLHVRYCDIFCKGEKQQCDNKDEPPKNRCISALCAQHKKVMGPVVYSLEQYMKRFKGYCGGMNWTDIGKCIDNWHRTGGYQVVQSDVSGMDRSIVQQLKEIVFNAIYQLVEHAIDHVDINIWRLHAYPTVTRMNAQMFIDGGKQDLGYATISGTVFSGSCDTTLMNTLLTVILNRFTVETVLHISPCDYDLKAKGDDSMVVLDSNISSKEIIDAYSSVYYFAKDVSNPYSQFYLEHGCGLTLKYLHISDDFTDIDFCSTNCFYCVTCQQHRLTRRIDRFIELTPWSNAAINYNDEVRASYKQSLFDSNLTWMRGLPIFTELNNHLFTGNYKNYSLAGKQKKILPLTDTDKSWYNEFFKHESSYDDILRRFGKNEFYSMINQTGNIQHCCAASYLHWLDEKLNLDICDLTMIHDDIVNADDEYSSPTLTEGLNYYHAQRRAKQSVN